MGIKYFLFLLGILSLTISSYAYADARLEKKLGLDINQAKQVQEIQKKYRKMFSAKRQEFNRESRKLRRARIDNDSSTIAQQEQITAKLQEELKQIRHNENEEIRQVLTAEQSKKFEEIIKQRKASVGSSRDAKQF